MAIMIFLLGILFTLAITGDDFAEQLEVKDLIDQCQQELPRNETCKIIAIPDEGDEE